MELQNNFTTPEQSKRLLELGVPADSADCFYEALRGKNYDESGSWAGWKSRPVVITYSIPDWSKHSDWPCWSVGRMIELHELLFPEIDNFVIEKNDIPLIERMVRYFEICKEEIDFSKLEE